MRLHDTFHRGPSRSLRDPRPDWRGRHGRGLSRARRAAEALSRRRATKRFVARGPRGEAALWPIDGGEPAAIPAMLPADAILGSAGRDGVVWMRRGGRGKIPVRVVRFDLSTGKEEPWRELAPADLTGIVDFLGVQVTPDGRSYALSYGRQLSDLYAIEGSDKRRVEA